MSSYIAEINKDLSKKLIKKYGDLYYDTWLKDIELSYIYDNSIIIETQNNFIKEIMIKNHLNEIKDLYAKLLPNHKLLIISKKKKSFSNTTTSINKIPTAKEMKIIADNNNNKQIEFEEEISKTLNRILHNLQGYANKGLYETSLVFYLTLYKLEVINKVLSILEENDYIVHATEYDDNVTALINWK